MHIIFQGCYLRNPILEPKKNFNSDAYSPLTFADSDQILLHHHTPSPLHPNILLHHPIPHFSPPSLQKVPPFVDKLEPHHCTCLVLPQIPNLRCWKS